MNSGKVLTTEISMNLDNNREDLFRSYIKNYRSMVAKLINEANNKHSILFNSMDIDDVLQESIVVLYEKITDPTFNLTSKESTFIYSVIKNKINERVRKTKIGVNIDYDAEMDESIYDDYDKVKDTNIELNIIKLRDCISKLSETKRKVFEYFYYHNYSLKKIAELTGLASEGSATTQKFRAFKLVEECVKS
jgi:RNA polymerase sigma factor (sigma-70 family)